MTVEDRDLYGLIDGEYPWAEYIQAISKGIAGWHIRSDTVGTNTYLRAVQRGAGANMSVDVGAGTLVADSGNTYTEAGTTNLAVTSDGSNPRYYLIVYDYGSTAPVAIAGTAEAYPNPPSVSAADQMPLALVYLAAAETSVTDSMITDLRLLKYHAAP